MPVDSISVDILLLNELIPRHFFSTHLLPGHRHLAIVIASHLFGPEDILESQTNKMQCPRAVKNGACRLASVFAHLAPLSQRREPAAAWLIFKIFC